MDDNKQKVLNLIKELSICVLSTVDNINMKPQSAVVNFAQNDHLELIFHTFNFSRKYKNLKVNTNVSVVIGWEEGLTVQYEGVAVELSGEERNIYKQLYFNKLPEMKRWEGADGITYFKIVPSWIRLTDLNTYPWTIHEIII